MCGICGFTGREDAAVLRRMTETLRHRGPDDAGYLSDGSVNLGIRRLSIIDVETGHQPLANENRTVWTVYNGEIYNFPALRSELAAAGHTFSTHHSDTEVIVHLYEELGSGFPSRLNGMFAIALWDSGERSLLLVRDRMGVKPLYYARHGEVLLFASEIKAILAYPDFPKKINHEALYHYFTFKHIPSPLTAFEGVRALRPGEMLRFSGGKPSTRRWWRLAFEEDHHRDEQATREQLLSLLDDATRIRMISDVPFGAYLSGGVDSSTVVALMKRHMRGPLKTFALGYTDRLDHKEEDLVFARKVAESFGTEHREHLMSHQELVDDIARVVGSFDQPFSGVISTFFLSKLITRHVKVALSGDGADELFGSYLSHRTALPLFHFSRLRGKVLSNSLSEAEKRLLEPCDPGYLADLYTRSGGAEVDWRYRLYQFDDEQKKHLLSEAFTAPIDGTSTYKLLQEYFTDLTAGDPLNRILEMEWNTQLPDQVLAFVDFLSMAHSVEIRSPFLDYRLVEFAATIPGSWKIRSGVVKDVLKKTVEPLLPEGVTRRPKEGFVLPVYHWLTEKLRDYSEAVLSQKRLGRHGFLRPEAVRQELADYREGRPGAAGRIWNLMMFQLWWEEYFG